jgi:thiosulfate reductase / polysulfide reductase chain A
MSARVSRRGFLKATVASAAAGSVVLPHREAHAFGVGSTYEALAPEREVPSFCELCFWNCGLKARVRGNRVLALRGNPDHPNARGKLCGRGQAGAASLTDGDRLKYPQIRTGARGEGKFRRAGWKEAYRVIAEGFARIKAQHGARALGLFYHGCGGPFMRALMVAYGSPNFAGPSYSQCKAARNVGYKLTFGEKIPTPEPLDFESTRCMVLFGSHLGENAHNSQVQEFVRARARGTSLIVLDPRLSTAAGMADVWLPLKPGSDLAVILAWLHLLVAEEAYDKAFVAERCLGFDELKAHVATTTPAWAAQHAGVEERAIRRAYELIKAARPAVLVHPGRHTSWYGDADTQRARSQAILTALLGAWWAPGGLYRPEAPSVPDFPGPDWPELPKDVDQVAGRFPFAQEVTTNGIRDATMTGRPYPIKGWLVHGTNVLQSMPNREETLAAIKALDLLVVCDVQPTEITRYADVLLPEDLYLERYDDIQLVSGKRPFVSLRQPVVATPHDTRPAWRIAKELATEMGVGDYFAYATMEEYLETRLGAAGLSFAELKAKGVLFPPRKTKPFLEAGEEVHFHTPSGKVELYSKQLADKGFDPLPVFRPQPAPPQGSFRLLYGRSPLHSFGRTQNNPILFDLDPGNDLWIHPRPAAALGLRQGDAVLVRNAHGDVTGPLPVKLTERMPEDAVYMVHGFGQRAPGLTRTNGRGGDDTALIRGYVLDNISGATGMRTEPVTVQRAGAGRG